MRILAFLSLAAICGFAGGVYADEPLPVVATIFPVADLVRNVGGVHVSVTTLLPAGASPHTFDPKPSQVRQVSEARVVFAIGAGLDLWIDKLVEASAGSGRRVVRLSEGMSLLDNEGHHHGEANGAHHGNPHFWLDPVHAASMLERIGTVLSELDPAHEGDYLANALGYARALVALHEEIQTTIADFKSNAYVAFHPAWAYFAERYGLECAGIIEESPGKEATPRHLERIIHAIEEHRVPVVLAEPQLNPKAANVIARETGARVVFLDPLGGEDVEGRDSYLNLMLYNLGEMKKAFGSEGE